MARIQAAAKPDGTNQAICQDDSTEQFVHPMHGVRSFGPETTTAQVKVLRFSIVSLDKPGFWDYTSSDASRWIRPGRRDG